MSYFLPLTAKVTVALVFALLIFTTCSTKDSDPKVEVVLPTVTTTALSEITDAGAKSSGSITSAGGGTSSARGLVWGTASGPAVTLATKTSDGAGVGDLTSTITGLSAGTKYFARAYATASNSIDTRM